MRRVVAVFSIVTNTGDGLAHPRVSEKLHELPELELADRTEVLMSKAEGYGSEPDINSLNIEPMISTGSRSRGTVDRGWRITRDRDSSLADLMEM